MYRIIRSYDNGGECIDSEHANYSEAYAAIKTAADGYRKGRNNVVALTIQHGNDLIGFFSIYGLKVR